MCADALLCTALQELQQALEQEDYARAAQLRDSGCAGLVGWWHSRAEDDPVGHILRIAPDFGRYTAVKYSAQDLAELKVPFCCLLSVNAKFPAQCAVFLLKPVSQ